MLLILFGSMTFSGCGPKMVDIDQLIVAPEPHIGSEVKVSGEIYDIVREGGSVIGKSFTISLTSKTGVELLKCEFERGKESPPHHLRDGQWVTVTGVVDVVRGETILRRCQIE
jgi:hypothetical protein